MFAEPDTTLDAVFAALADPTRRAIVQRLARGRASVTELAAPFRLSQPAISKHLKVLEQAGLVSHAREAQRRPRQLEPQRIKQLSDWIGTYRQYLEASYERLENYLQTLKDQTLKDQPLEDQPLADQALADQAPQDKEDSHDHPQAGGDRPGQ